MAPRTKLTYHPYLIIAFRHHCLLDDLSQRIPRSTRFDWGNKALSFTFGSEWACQQQQLFGTLQQIAGSQKLLRVNVALLRIIAIKKFLYRHAARASSKAVQQVVLTTIEKVSTVFKARVVLKYLHHSAGWLQQLKHQHRCVSSPSLLFRLKHPG